MKTKTGLAALTVLVALALAPTLQTLGADSTDQAQEVKDRIEALRLESV